jgi:hypothetical protein
MDIVRGVEKEMQAGQPGSRRLPVALLAAV